jgi:hypothetical protein
MWHRRSRGLSLTTLPASASSLEYVVSYVFTPATGATDIFAGNDVDVNICQLCVFTGLEPGICILRKQAEMWLTICIPESSMTLISRRERRRSRRIYRPAMSRPYSLPGERSERTHGCNQLFNRSLRNRRHQRNDRAGDTGAGIRDALGNCPSFAVLAGLERVWLVTPGCVPENQSSSS